MTVNASWPPCATDVDAALVDANRRLRLEVERLTQELARTVEHTHRQADVIERLTRANQSHDRVAIQPREPHA